MIINLKDVYIIKFYIDCHYSCNTCFGPNINHCIDCGIQSVSKRYLDGTYCPCISAYIDVG